jgi:hypothetical protein
MGWPGAASWGNNWQTPPKRKRQRRDKNLGFNGSSFKLMSAPRPVSWIGEAYGSTLPTRQSFEIAALKGITALDAMATEKP